MPLMVRVLSERVAVTVGHHRSSSRSRARRRVCARMRSVLRLRHGWGGPKWSDGALAAGCRDALMDKTVRGEEKRARMIWIWFVCSGVRRLDAAFGRSDRLSGKGV